jgi:hypothetical protein
MQAGNPDGQADRPAGSATRIKGKRQTNRMDEVLAAQSAGVRSATR